MYAEHLIKYVDIHRNSIAKTLSSITFKHLNLNTMTLLAVGINYNTAPVSIRERLSFPAEILESSLQELWRLKEIK